MLSGFTRSKEIKMHLDSRHAGKCIWHKIWPNDIDWLAIKSDASDLRITDENDNLIPFGLDLWDHTYQMAQVRIMIPGTLPRKLFFQYKHTASIAGTANLAATFQAPGVDANTLAAWHCTESTGTTFANSVSGGSPLNVVGGCTHSDGTALGYKRQARTIAQVPSQLQTGPDGLVAPAGYVGFRLNGTSQAVQADAGFLDSPPESGTIAMWTWLFAGSSGTIISKRSDNDNYLLVEQIGNVIHVQKKNNGIVTSDWTSRTVIENQNPAMLLGVSWGSNGFRVWQNGIVQWENPADTSAWGLATGGSGSGKFTFGATDNGALSNFLSIGMIGWPTVHSKQLTSDEWGMRCYHIAFYPVETQATKFGPVRVVLDASASYEFGSSQEAIIVDTGTEYVALYHASMTGGSNSLCRATSPDLVNWTRDPNNPLLGNGRQGESNDIIFFGGGQIDSEQGFFTYSIDGTEMKISSMDLTAPSNANMTTPVAMLSNRANSWPSMVGNINIFRTPTGWLVALTGGGTNGPAWQGLFLTGPDLLSLTVPPMARRFQDCEPSPFRSLMTIFLTM